MALTCAMTTTNNCRFENSINASDTFLSSDDGIYCCNYVLGSDVSQLSQNDLLKHITLVRDLNIASLISDYVFVIIAIIVFMCLYNKAPAKDEKAANDNKAADKKVAKNKKADGKHAKQVQKDLAKAEKMFLIITALGSIVDIGITFSVVYFINQNNLIDTLFNLYYSSCYSEDIDLLLFDLQNQFETILILDSFEGALDLISLIVLFVGIFFCRENKTLKAMSEGIHSFMFIVFDLALITTNVFLFVLPTFDTFKSSYNNENYICYGTTLVPTIQQTPSPVTTSLQPTQAVPINTTTLSPTFAVPTRSPFQTTLTPTPSSVQSSVTNTGFSTEVYAVIGGAILMTFCCCLWCFYRFWWKQKKSARELGDAEDELDQQMADNERGFGKDLDVGDVAFNPMASGVPGMNRPMDAFGNELHTTDVQNEIFQVRQDFGSQKYGR
eukprot:282701_1